MSKYDSKRYFWLKLKDDFFDDDAIEWLEEQPNGKEYVLFYLKLCLKSLKHDCCLIRTVGNMLIPYDAKKLGELTRTKEDTVIVALELLKRIGLVDLQENGALFMAKVSEMIGSETNAAARMRKSRKKAKELGVVNKVLPMLQNCSPELELEKEIDKEIDKDTPPTQSKKTKVQYAEAVKMTEAEYAKLVAQIGEEGAKWCIDKLNNYKLSKGKNYKNDYRAILNWTIGEYEKQNGKTEAIVGLPSNDDGFYME